MTDFAKLVMGADTSGLKEALKDLADLATGADKTEKKNNVLNKSLIALGAAGAVAATALAVGVKSAINTADSYAKLSQRLGIAVTDLGALAHAADLSGVSLDSVAMGVQFLSRNMANALADATGATAQSFKTLNISVTDAQGNLRGTQDVLNDLADRFQAMPDGAQKTAFAMDLVGRGGAALIPLLNGGSEAMEDMRKEAEALGLVMSEQTAKDAEIFNDDLSRVASGLTGVFNIIAAQVLPSLVTLSGNLVALTKDGVQFFRDNLDTLGTVLEHVLIAATSIAVFMAGKFAVSLAITTAGAITAAGALAALKTALLTTGVGALVIGAGELVALLIRLKMETGSWGEAFALVGGVIKGVFMDFKQWAETLVSGTGALFKGLWEAIKAGATGEDMSDAFLSAFKNIEFGASKTLDAIAAMRAGITTTKDETVDAAEQIAVAVGAAAKSYDYARVVTEDADVSAGTLNQTYYKTIKALKDQTGNVGKSGKAMAIWTAQANLGWRASDNMLESVGRLAGELYDLEEAESKGAAVKRAVMTDQQKLNEMIAEYAMFLSEGVINQDEFTRAVEKFKAGLTDLTDTRSIGEQMWDGLKSAFFDPFKKGSEEMADKFAAQVDRMSQAADRMANGKSTVDKLQGGLDVLANIPGPIGAVAGALSKAISVVKSVVGIVKSVGKVLFGGSFETTGGGLQLQLGAMGGVTGQTYEDQRKSGGLFSGSKNRTIFSNVGSDQSAQFNAAYSAILDNAATAFSLFGMDASREMMEQVRIAALNIKTSGEGALSEADAVTAVENWFKQLDAAIVGAVGGEAIQQLLDLATDGEAATETLIRLGNQLNTVNGLLGLVDLSLYDIGINGAVLADSLVKAVGGMDALQSGVNSFFSNFYTQEEQFEKLNERLNDTFAALNMTLPTTRAGVRDLVEGLDLTTEAGQAAFAAIINSSDALNAYFTTLEKNAENAAQAAIDATNAAQKIIDDAAEAAADAAAAAAEAAADAAEALRQATEEAAQAAIEAAKLLAETLRDQSNAALSALRNSIDQEKKIKQAAYNDAVSLIKQEAEVRTKAANLALDAARDNLSAIQGEVTGVMNALGGLKSQINPAGSRQNAVALLKAALQSGNLTGTGAAAQEAAQLNAGNFANAAAFRREQARTINLLSDISDVGTEQINYAELTVRGIENEIEAIRQSTSELIDVETLLFEQQIEALDKQYTTAENSLNVLRGINTGILSVEAALKDFYSAITAERNNGGVPPGVSIETVKPGREVMTVQIASTLEEIKKYSQATAVSTTKDFNLNDRQWREAQAELVV